MIDLGQQEDPGFLEDKRDKMPSSSWMLRSVSDALAAGAFLFAALARLSELFDLSAMRGYHDCAIQLYDGGNSEQWPHALVRKA